MNQHIDGRMQRESNNASAQSMYFNLGDGSANALALSKDNSYVVVAGRNVFKILAVNEGSFEEKTNLRVGKNLNLNYSCNDVVWSHLDENYIATGATNGAVVLWNLSKSSRSKQEHVFPDHQRTVHKVIFHPSDANLLLSGSQDGTVKSFDLRTTEAKMTYTSNSESVRDIQFVPRNTNYFTSVSENGSVQLWDIRKNVADRPSLVFTAHAGPVFSCDWHPENPNLLATAGRDRAIKVWNIDLAGNLAELKYTIHTVASVGRIKWRPQKTYHIGSTSLVVDASICIWDVRRPFVPLAAFEKHNDIVTGISWKSSPHVFISTSKDCTVWQHVFKDASHPSQKAIPQALALNIRGGEIAQAVTTYQSSSSSSTRASMLKKNNSYEDQFHLARSRFFMYRSLRLLKMSLNVPCAVRYVLSGKTPLEMCHNNAQIAKDLKLYPVSLLWEIAGLHCQHVTSAVISPREMISKSKHGVENASSHSVLKEEKDSDIRNYSDNEDGNNSSSETEKHELLTDIASGLHMSKNLLMLSSPTYDFQVQPEWQTLPEEAFQMRHEIKAGNSPPLHLEDCSTREMEESLETVAIENRTNQLSICRPPAGSHLDLCHPIVRALHYHARLGDVQTAVSVWIVLSSLVKLPIDKRILEDWCYGYVEMLQRHMLFVQAASVIKHCGVLEHLSQESTTYIIACGKCGKPLSKKGANYCEKCRKAVARCCICHGTVTGLMSWCQGCGHGGHLSHVLGWFQKHDECPVGCGHHCYN